MENKPKNPYLDIWFNTSEAIDNVLSEKIKFNFYLPIFLSVLSTYISDEIFQLTGDIFLSILTLILIVLISFGLIIMLIPWLILKTGRIWNGRANKKEILTIIGLAQIPVLVFLFEQVIFYSLGSSIPETGTNQLLQFIIWIFYLRIIIIGISKIQGFSYMIAILNLIVAILPFIILRLLFV